MLNPGFKLNTSGMRANYYVDSGKILIPDYLKDDCSIYFSMGVVLLYFCFSRLLPVYVIFEQLWFLATNSFFFGWGVKSLFVVIFVH